MGTVTELFPGKKSNVDVGVSEGEKITEELFESIKVYSQDATDGKEPLTDAEVVKLMIVIMEAHKEYDEVQMKFELPKGHNLAGDTIENINWVIKAAVAQMFLNRVDAEIKRIVKAR